MKVLVLSFPNEEEYEDFNNIFADNDESKSDSMTYNNTLNNKEISSNSNEKEYKDFENIFVNSNERKSDTMKDNNLNNEYNSSQLMDQWCLIRTQKSEISLDSNVTSSSDEISTKRYNKVLDAKNIVHPKHHNFRKCIITNCFRKSKGGESKKCIRHGGGKKCEIDGCNKSVQSKNRCKKHGGGRKCKYNGCNTNYFLLGYCRKHQPNFF